MSLIDKFTKKLSLNKGQNHQVEKMYGVFSHLSHDVKNCLVAIHTSAASIQRQLNMVNPNAQDVEAAIGAIDKKINHAVVLLDMVRVALMSEEHMASDEISLLSIKDVIAEAIKSYPFPAEKYASHIVLMTPFVDFSIKASRRLVLNVFYCLIKNALQAIYMHDCEITICLVHDSSGKRVQIKFPVPLNDKLQSDNYDLLALETPEYPGDGYNFIARVMQQIGGSSTFINDPIGATINLLFPDR